MDPIVLRRWIAVVADNPNVMRGVVGAIQLKIHPVIAEFFGAQFGFALAARWFPRCSPPATLGVVQAAHTQWFVHDGDLATTMSESLAVLERSISTDPRPWAVAGDVGRPKEQAAPAGGGRSPARNPANRTPPPARCQQPRRTQVRDLRSIKRQTAGSVDTWPSALACISAWELGWLAAPVVHLVKMHATTACTAAAYRASLRSTRGQSSTRPYLITLRSPHLASNAKSPSRRSKISTVRIVTQECPGDQPDRHTADSSGSQWATVLVAARAQRASCTVRGERGLRIHCDGLFPRWSGGRCSPQILRRSGRPCTIIDGHRILRRRNDTILFAEGVIGKFRSGGCGGGAEEDGRPPLFRFEFASIIEDRMTRGDAQVVS